MSQSHSVPYINYWNVDIKYLRDRVKYWLFNDQQHRIFGSGTNLRFLPLKKYGAKLIPQDRDFLESYYRLQILAEQVAALNYKLVKEQSRLPIEKDEEGFLLISNLIKKDTQRVVLPVALTAWLTIDEFRWHHHSCEVIAQSIPEDLSYGLVLAYPEYVVPYACFVLDTHRQKQLNLIDQESLQACEAIISQIVQAMVPFS